MAQLLFSHTEILFSHTRGEDYLPSVLPPHTAHTCLSCRALSLHRRERRAINSPDVTTNQYNQTIRGEAFHIFLLGNVIVSSGDIFLPRGEANARGKKVMLPLEKTMPALERRLPQLVKQTLYSWNSYMYSNKICLHAKGEACHILLFSWGVLSFRVGMSFFPSCIRFASALRSSTDCKGGIR